MRNKNLNIDIFEWINHKFELLNAKMITQDNRFKQLKDAVAFQIKDIIQIDAQKAIELIDYWYDNSFADSLIVGELSEYPELQFNFLKKFLHFNQT